MALREKFRAAGVTITKGTNIIGGTSRQTIIEAVRKQLVLFGSNVEGVKEREAPPLWDGKAAERIVNILAREIYG